MKKRIAAAAVFTVAAAVLTAALAYLIISGKLVYPCVFYKYLGVYCPGCGATRAARLLLQGEVAAAVRMTPYIFAAAPVLIYILARCMLSYITGKPYSMNRIEKALILGLAAAGVIFTVLRNIPGFEFLAPFEI